MNSSAEYGVSSGRFGPVAAIATTLASASATKETIISGGFPRRWRYTSAHPPTSIPSKNASGAMPRYAALQLSARTGGIAEASLSFACRTSIIF